jgi:hypothetical protein
MQLVLETLSQKNPSQQKGADGMAQGIGPEPPYHKNLKKKV